MKQLENNIKWALIIHTGIPAGRLGLYSYLEKLLDMGRDPSDLMTVVADEILAES